MSAADDFEHKVRADDAAIELAGAAIDVARTAYPHLDEAFYLAQLDKLADSVIASAPQGTEQHISALKAVLFEQFGLRGNTGDYYDVRNSYLNEVLERRQGIPISLSLIYLEVGWRSGFAMAPVSFPGHFLVRLDEGNGLSEKEDTPLLVDPFIVDPFNGGAIVALEALTAQLARATGDEQTAKHLLPKALQPCSRREMLARILQNLEAIYTQKNAWESALTIADLAVRLDPRNASAVRKRGALYAHVGHGQAAIADLERYLAMDKAAEDASRIKALIARLRGATGRLS
ncbi:MAG: tetratricopeptide repeat protein [Gammaproteobacteria bacterium]|nr:tetratricopeptide repeat protein [Gammaproteobacteria bacterium]